VANARGLTPAAQMRYHHLDAIELLQPPANQ